MVENMGMLEESRAAGSGDEIQLRFAFCALSKWDFSKVLKLRNFPRNEDELQLLAQVRVASSEEKSVFSFGA